VGYDTDTSGAAGDTGTGRAVDDTDAGWAAGYPIDARKYRRRGGRRDVRLRWQVDHDVSGRDEGRAVAHREDGVANCVAAERLDHDGLPVSVEAGRGLVEEEDRAAQEQGAGQRDAAALAGRQAGSALAQDPRKRDVVEGGVPGGGGHRRLRCVGPAEADVVCDRADEQGRVLR
jgi:hypothetical protein